MESNTTLGKELSLRKGSTSSALPVRADIGLDLTVIIGTDDNNTTTSIEVHRGKNSSVQTTVVAYTIY